ncbi:MAG: hypothetical protein ACREGI_02265 [Candidatus Levyibacteriota bacterium]
MKKLRLLLIGYFITVIGLFLYSYTQVDLGLTLSRASIYQTLEKGFQYIGYFQRPLSTLLYIIILAVFFLFYFFFILFAIKKKISQRAIWIVVIATTIILTFSYNAFSYDLFNYIFDAKIITHYHLNPYFHKALDFPNDPMLGFMHWTQRTYVYGPLWLVLTVPFSFIGLQYFLPTFFLFKILVSGFFLGTVYFLSKLIKKYAPQQELLGVVLFALNPLVIIESLVSSHNDIVMIFFALWGIYLLHEKKYMLGLLSIIVSPLVKQATVFLILPAFFYSFIRMFMKNIAFSFKFFLIAAAIFIGAGFVFVLQQREMQPWYFIWLLPFFSFFTINKYTINFVIGTSLGLLLRYAPFLYQGNWDGVAVPIRFYVSIITPMVFVGVVFLADIIKSFKK